MSPGLSNKLLMSISVVDVVIRVVDVLVVEDVSVVEVVVSWVISCMHITDVAARKITRRGNCFFISITPAVKLADSALSG